jgi:hypothetical protein
LQLENGKGQVLNYKVLNLAYPRYSLWQARVVGSLLFFLLPLVTYTKYYFELIVSRASLKSVRHKSNVDERICVYLCSPWLIRFLFLPRAPRGSMITSYSQKLQPRFPPPTSRGQALRGNDRRESGDDILCGFSTFFAPLREK